LHPREAAGQWPKGLRGSTQTQAEKAGDFEFDVMLVEGTKRARFTPESWAKAPDYELIITRMNQFR
jgi:hypothetical protein